MTNAGLSDATTVASHDSASTSMTPPADSRLASKRAHVDRNSSTSNVRREGIRAGGWWQGAGSQEVFEVARQVFEVGTAPMAFREVGQPLIQMMVHTRRAAKKAVRGSRRPVIDRKIDTFVSNDGVGLHCRLKPFFLVAL